MTFDDLVFNPTWIGGIQAIASFDNGYGASVVKSPTSYGGAEGLYEIAVLKDGKIVYDTSITDDVLGYLSEKDVTKVLNDIASL